MLVCVAILQFRFSLIEFFHHFVQLKVIQNIFRLNELAVMGNLFSSNSVSANDYSYSYWYEAELARSGRSCCKEFRCKEQIEEGELRIGIKVEKSDHYGDTIGWYHPKCLWRTFDYHKNANKRITKTEDIIGFDGLDDHDVEVFKKLIKSRRATNKSTSAVSLPKTVGVKRSSISLLNISNVFVPWRGLLTLSAQESFLVVTGDTYPVKDMLKATGVRWNGGDKSWMFGAPSHVAILKLFDLTAPPLFWQTVPLSEFRKRVAKQEKANKTNAINSNATSAESDADVQSKSNYAMAGTISFRIVQNTQDIEVRGNTAHIAARLTAAGGVLQSGHHCVGELWVFSTQSRQGARKFFCMPDELPPAEVLAEIDLIELGQKQVCTTFISD